VKSIWIVPVALCSALAAAPHAAAQAPNAAMLEAQAKAMAALSFMDGEWAGPAQALEPSGPIKMTQTERSGTLLGGTVRLIEGRAYDDKGATLFNALAVITYDVRTKRYVISSHASGYATTTELTLTSDGFEWAVPAGPNARIQFKAVVQNGVWTEIGNYVGPDGQPRQTFQMTVRKLRPTTWPAETPVRSK
jgi:hypothetical protein